MPRFVYHIVNDSFASDDKDGFDLPDAQRTTGAAEVRLFPGETYDFEFESSADVLRLLTRNPNVADGDEDITVELRAR